MTETGPIHPGEHLADILRELGVSRRRLAEAVGMPTARISRIVRGRRPITADAALRIGQALRTTPDFRLNLQRLHDHDMEAARASTDVSAIAPLVETAA